MSTFRKLKLIGIFVLILVVLGIATQIVEATPTKHDIPSGVAGLTIYWQAYENGAMLRITVDNKTRDAVTVNDTSLPSTRKMYLEIRRSDGSSYCDQDYTGPVVTAGNVSIPLNFHVDCSGADAGGITDGNNIHPIFGTASNPGGCAVTPAHATINARAEASTTSAIVGRFLTGNYASVTGRTDVIAGHRWYTVTDGKDNAFVREDVVAQVGDCSAYPI